MKTSEGAKWWYKEEALEQCQSNGAIVQKGSRLSVGDMVKLTKKYADFGDASEGPLKPGPGPVFNS